jgi:hypothetical protein
MTVRPTVSALQLALSEVRAFLNAAELRAGVDHPQPRTGDRTLGSTLSAGPPAPPATTVGSPPAPRWVVTSPASAGSGPCAGR